MQSGWRIGSIFGIPLLLDSSWFLILALVTVANGYTWQDSYPDWNLGLAWLAGLLAALLLFASVLLHELGHSLVARAQGIQVNSITLFLFGGIASIDRESKTPGQAFQVAIAGPLVSFALFGLLSSVAGILPAESAPSAMAANLARINLVLAAFNLIPGLPLDGGQVLKAIVWKATGSRFKGIHWAAVTGQFLGGLAIVAGVYWAFSGGASSGGIWIALIGWFVYRNANAYDRLTQLQEVLLTLKAADAATRAFRIVDGDLSLRQFVEQYALSPDRPVYFAAARGRYQGLLLLEDLQAIERSRWDALKVSDLAHPLDTIPSVPENASLAQAVRLLDAQNQHRLTVLAPAGSVAGVLDRGDVVRAVARKLELPFSDADIERVKQEASYPPSLPLGAIAGGLADERA